MQRPVFNLEISIAEILHNWPQTVQVFLDHRMICVGCHMSRFDTLADAIENYNLSADKFVQILNEVISNQDG